MKRIILFIATNIAIVLLISVILMVTGANHFITRFGLDYSTLLVYSLIIGFTGSFISLWMSKWMAKMAYNIHIIERPGDRNEEWLVGTVRELASKAKIQMPEVGIYESPEVNAFATGPSRSNSLVAVSSGLLNSMEPDEIKAVLAHEVSHVSNGDMVTMTLLQGVLNTFVVFLSTVAAYFIDQALRRDNEESRGPGLGYYIANFVFQIVLGFLASLIVLSFSRHREFHADAGSARLCGKENMINALRRLNQIMHADPIFDDRSAALSSFKISGPENGFGDVFASHPSLEARIAALERLP